MRKAWLIDGYTRREYALKNKEALEQMTIPEAAAFLYCAESTAQKVMTACGIVYRRRDCYYLSDGYKTIVKRKVELAKEKMMANVEKLSRMRLDQAARFLGISLTTYLRLRKESGVDIKYQPGPKTGGKRKNKYTFQGGTPDWSCHNNARMFEPDMGVM